jgi:hypothetical protein
MKEKFIEAVKNNPLLLSLLYDLDLMPEQVGWEDKRLLTLVGHWKENQDRQLELAKAECVLWSSTFQRYESILANGEKKVPTEIVIDDYRKCKSTTGQSLLDAIKQKDKALKLVEWVDSDYRECFCPYCHALKSDGHKPLCMIGQALVNKEEM